ncbi:MAG: hypothetical protein ACT4NX_04390 [Deltaproteobacteria bacterium]
MGKFILVMPYSRIIFAGVMLGVGLVIGVKIGAAAVRIAARGARMLRS